MKREMCKRVFVMLLAFMLCAESINANNITQTLLHISRFIYYPPQIIYSG